MAEATFSVLRAEIVETRTGPSQHLEYAIKVHEHDGLVVRRVWRRYTEFRELHAAIANTLNLAPLGAPKLLLNSAQGLQERHDALQRFLSDAVNAARQMPSVELSRFLGDATPSQKAAVSAALQESEPAALEVSESAALQESATAAAVVEGPARGEVLHVDAPPSSSGGSGHEVAAHVDEDGDAAHESVDVDAPPATGTEVSWNTHRSTSD